MSVLVVSLIAFVLGFVGAMPILGPIAVMVISRGVEGRFAEARRLGIGAAIAEGIYAGVAFATFATLFGRYPAAIPISKILTSIVLLVVGIQFVRYTPKPVGEGAPTDNKKGRRAFPLGFFTSFFNPTILATWTAVATGIYSRQIVEMKSWLAIPFGVSACLGIVAWYVVLVALMTKYHSRLPARFLLVSIRVMGGVLILIAAWNAFGLLGARGMR